MPIKIPRRMIAQLDEKIREQQRRVERATRYLNELKAARADVEPLEPDFDFHSKGGSARAVKLSPTRRSAIASHASRTRWAKKPTPLD